MTARGFRVAVTGVGAVSGLAIGARETFDALLRGDRAFRAVSLFDATKERCRIAAEVRDLRVSDVAVGPDRRSWSRTDAMAVAAAREACAMAALDSMTLRETAVAVGATTGGMFEAEDVFATLPSGAASVASAQRLVSYPLSTTAERIGLALGARGARATVCSACSSGANAIIRGAAWIATGAAPAVLAGGADGLCRLTFAGFNALLALDPSPCRPFDRTRAGTNLGEGAAFLVLEAEEAAARRGAQALAWLIGWASGAEAHHITQPEPSGATAAHLLSCTLRRADVLPADVEYVNAHGTGTVPNDAMEARALRTAFGDACDSVKVSSIKGQLGHTLGAAGALEAVVTILGLESHRAPKTVGFSEPDEATHLRHVRETEVLSGGVALSSSFGFGGAGAVLAFSPSDAAHRGRPPRQDATVVTGVATIGPLGVLCGADNAAYASARVEDVRFTGDPLAELEPKRSRRFDRATAMVVVGTERALRDSGRRPEGVVGLVVGTAYGTVERSVEFIRTFRRAGARRSPPAEFPHLVPSAAVGNASVYWKLTGPALSTCDVGASAEVAVHLARDWLAAAEADAYVAGTVEPLDRVVSELLAPIREGRRCGPRGEGGAWLVLERQADALDRGGRVLAVVTETLQVPLGQIPRIPRIAAPRSIEHAVVVMGVEEEDPGPLLGSMGWGSVPRRSVLPATGWHEGLGGFALAAAVGLVARERAHQALACAVVSGQCFLTTVESPP